jgi:hypothetical protein
VPIMMMMMTNFILQTIQHWRYPSVGEFCKPLICWETLYWCTEVSGNVPNIFLVQVCVLVLQLCNFPFTFLNLRMSLIYKQRERIA